MATFQWNHTVPNILCCICGVPMSASNSANMCVNCLRTKVDITDGIPKQLSMNYCKNCACYLQPPNHWVFCELESRELLSLCMKRIRGLNKVKLVDAGFVYTEPHSKRLKVKLTIQKEVFTGTILQQVFIVEFIVLWQQCDKCARVAAKDTWNAVAQVRQKVDHKRTFFFLEQLILKHGVHSNTTNIKETPDGLDFFFNHRSHALKFVDFLQSVTPIRFKTSERLISHDASDNTYNYKYTFAIEIAPICREDLICLPAKVAASMGNISPLVLCFKVSNMIHVIDPLTLQTAEITSSMFWKFPFRSISTHAQLLEYIILDISPLGPVNGKFVLCDVQVARTSDFGRNDKTYLTRTHLGHLLKPGDYAMGYDVSSGNYNDADLTGLRGRALPDVLLVKKWFPGKRRHPRRRHWKLRTLDKEEDESIKKHERLKAEKDYEEFLHDIEEDPDYRSNINLYKEENAEDIVASRANAMVDDGEGEDPDFPDVELDELMDELAINDADGGDLEDAQ